MIRRFVLVVLVVVNLVLLVKMACGGQVTLAWDANDPAPDGYRVFMRIEGQGYDYNSPAWQGTATSCTVDNLQEGLTYYFVARAFAGDAQSGDSNEVFYAVPAYPALPTGISLTKEGGKMFLISNPQPADTVDYFEVELDGAIVRSDAAIDGDQARLHHDLAGIAMGAHTVRVCAVNGWGSGPWTDPFAFTAQLPGAVSGVGLSVD